jgi:hypothetical protein
MADIVDRHVVMLAPEEGDRVKRLPLAEHAAGGVLTHPLGHHPMFYPNPFATAGLDPARDVAGREYACRTGLQSLVHENASIDSKARLPGQLQVRPNTHTRNHEIRSESSPIVQNDAP